MSFERFNDRIVPPEVANTSLQNDRTIKASLYAKAGILEYWILAVNTQQVYVFRDPQDDGYAQEIVLTKENTVSAIAFPDLPIALNQLFPEAPVITSTLSRVMMD